MSASPSSRLINTVTSTEAIESDQAAISRILLKVGINSISTQTETGSVIETTKTGSWVTFTFSPDGVLLAVDGEGDGA